MLIAMDHDQRFKTLIREFFADFLSLFFAACAARLDLSPCLVLRTFFFEAGRGKCRFFRSLRGARPAAAPKT